MGKINITSYTKIQSPYQNITTLDSYINQSLLTTDDVAFRDLLLSGDLTVTGDLNVKGIVTYLESDIIRFKDNLILLNADETGPGVILNRAGFSVDRGPDLDQAYMVFQESDQSFRAGIGENDLRRFAFLEETPTDGSFLIYDAASKLLVANNSFSQPMDLLSTENATSLTSNAALKVAGGAVIRKNLFIGAQLHFATDGIFSFDHPYISGDVNNDLNIYSYNDIKITADSMLLTNNMPIYFGSRTALYTDSLNNENFYIATHSNVKTIFTSQVQFNDTLKLPPLLEFEQFSINATTDYIDINSFLFPTSILRLQPNDGYFEVSTPSTESNVFLKYSLPVTFTEPPSITTAPTLQNHAVNKEYVDSVAVDTPLKAYVDCASRANVDIESELVIGGIIDDYFLIQGSRVLLKDQIVAKNNGIYVITDTIAERSSDFSGEINADGFVVFVLQGNWNKGHGFIVTSTQSLIDSSDIIFEKFSGTGLINAGTGITIDHPTDTITVKSDLSHVTKVGELTSGRWKAQTVEVIHGGSGRTSIPQNHIVFGNGENPFGYDSNFTWNPITQSLTVNGHISTTGLISSPTYSPDITLSNLVNIDIISFEYSVSKQNGDMVTLIIQVSVIPAYPFALCQFRGSIPNKTSPIANYKDLIIFVNGYESKTTNDCEPLLDLNVHPLLGEKKFLAKFFSHSTHPHYINIQLNYNLT